MKLFWAAERKHRKQPDGALFQGRLYVDRKHSKWSPWSKDNDSQLFILTFQQFSRTWRNLAELWLEASRWAFHRSEFRSIVHCRCQAKQKVSMIKTQWNETLPPFSSLHNIFRWKLCYFLCRVIESEKFPSRFEVCLEFIFLALSTQTSQDLQERLALGVIDDRNEFNKERMSS